MNESDWEQSAIDEERLSGLAPEVRDAITAGRQFLITEQGAGGLWSGRTQPTIQSTAEYILLQAWFGLAAQPMAAQSVHYIRERVDEIGDSINANEAALARLVLHVVDTPASAPVCAALEQYLADRGGLPATSNTVRLFYALFNQVEFDDCDPNCPEFLLLPSWLTRHGVAKNRWTRVVQVPGAILTALKPKKVSIPQMPLAAAFAGEGLSGRRGRKLAGLGAKLATKVTPIGLRGWATRSAQRWILGRISAVSGLAGSSTASALAAIALNCLGYERSSPAITRCFDSMQHCQFDDGSVAAAREPVAQTALAIYGLPRAGVPRQSAGLQKAVEAVLACEVVREADWPSRSNVEPGGWAREQDNDHYPDVMCTAQMLIALRDHFATIPASSLVTDDSMVAMIRANTMRAARQRIALLDRVAAASRRARRWLIATQRRDGSWDAQHRPTSPNAANRPATIDEKQFTLPTGLVLKALGSWELRAGQKTIDRAVRYLHNSQSECGMWQRDGEVNFLATHFAVEGLLAVGIHPDAPEINRAHQALLALQEPDGGFGRIGKQGRILQTAWALLTLIRLPSERDAIDSAVRWLIYQQNPAGDWHNDAAGNWQGKTGRFSNVSVSIYALAAVAQASFIDAND